jgi:hypothetical protein
MALVEWNNALTDGFGRSGTRYTLSYECSAGDDADGVWWIGVEGTDVCALRSAEDAICHSEGLEAMRCILHGFGDQLDPDELNRGTTLAAEMQEAVEEALLRLPAGSEQQAELRQNLAALQSLADAIATECHRRQRGDREDPPLLN